MFCRNGSVEPLEPRIAPATFTATSIADSGAGSLHQAILDANAIPGPDKIVFNIPGAAPHIISPLSQLPAVTEAVKILGNTEPGYKGKPLIGLDGGAAGGTAIGLGLSSHSGSTIRGLAIYDFGGSGISITSGSNHKILGNYLGVDTGGNADGKDFGIRIALFSSANHIGGKSKALGNVISGNASGGIFIVQSDGTKIFGNYIGTDKSGTLDFGNGLSGVAVRVGAGTSLIQANLISGNDSDGITIAVSDDNIIRSNRIGTAKDGKSPLPNFKDGIEFSNCSDNNLALKNIIAHNGGMGIAVVDPGTVENKLSRNSFLSNGGLAIDLGPVGVTANDPGDGDPGPNALFNFPVITSTKIAGGITTIKGSLDNPAGTVRVEFYRAIADPSGHGEGAKFLGAINVTTDDFNAVPFTVQTAKLKKSQIVTAIAIATSGDTSEFASNVQI